jgi:NTP pyrophosphatase (non-canonical NTP hydrolase)
MIKELTFKEYHEKALETSICPDNMNILYPLIGLTGETGEVAEKVKKIYRDKNGVFNNGDKWEIIKELGDCLWYINKMAADLGYTLNDVATAGLNKCYKRRAEGTLHGEGDNR